ncbi:MAG: MBL fold metallo-hydrolase [Vicinamibacterales bacterium]|jgi:ribonuclease BN (tRNA processing enzyme)|nr:MBL fold metallo-hydrolase [Acidobacteriota bacterium]MDP6371961.1 MBL fold metallo-hydrolase [Vicinamibacterales bacterium]MDP6607736.1 MBL fold metallo-hydrolase [Vicinamibacterales bacterium]HAK55819.1 MBL fold metallo-hydrolase [Acidobacteriota bacterium]|tara:strand:+ start:9883 stop:10623 length:741 start_codon:yes stop_codon:yes gene_type:complete
MAVVLTVLGCGDAFGSGGRFQTCFAIDAGETRVLLDCGASSLVAMRQAGVDPRTIDAIFLTHLHGDHFGGLPFFILDAQFLSKRTAPLTVAGPPGTEARVLQAMETFFPGSTKVDRRFDTRFVELLPAQPTAVGTVVVTPADVVHGSGAPAYALRLEVDGRAIGYSGDTEWTEALLPIARDADLFICEASVFDKAIPGHITYTTLVARRAQLECRRLLLTHLGPDVLAQLDELEIDAATDGQVITL